MNPPGLPPRRLWGMGNGGNYGYDYSGWESGITRRSRYPNPKNSGSRNLEVGLDEMALPHFNMIGTYDIVANGHAWHFEVHCSFPLPPIIGMWNSKAI